MLLQELGNASNKIHERNLAKRENSCFFKNTSEIEDFRSSFAQTEGLAYPAHQCLWHLSCHVPCKTGMTRDGARVGSGNPPCLFGTRAEISSWGQSQRAEEAPCLGTHRANFWLDPVVQLSAKSSVNLSPVLLKLVFLPSLIAWFSLAPPDWATVWKQKWKTFLFENVPEDKALCGLWQQMMSYRNKSPGHSCGVNALSRSVAQGSAVAGAPLTFLWVNHVPCSWFPTWQLSSSCNLMAIWVLCSCRATEKEPCVL